MNAVVEKITLERFWSRFADHAAADALITSNDRFTYAELGGAAEALAGRLARSDICKGARIGIWCDSTPEFFIAMLAIWRVGAVAAPLDPKDQSERSREIIKKGQLNLLISKAGRDLPDALRRIPSIAFDHGELARSAKCDDSHFAASDALAAILFTSGSTGVSKGVMLSYRSILGNADSIASALGLRSADRLLINIPFHLTSAIGHFLACLTKGAACIALNEIAFGLELTARLASYRATAFGGAPIQLSRIIDHLAAQDKPTGELVPRLRMVMSSGDALPVGTIEKWRRYKPAVGVFTVYGLTELGARFCFLQPEYLPDKAGSVGKPIDGLAIALYDEKGAEIDAPGTIGQVHARGEFLMEGYFGDADAQASTLTQYGVATGDLGYIDEDGFLFLIGRSDDIFKCSGVKVSAKVVEDQLWELNLFADVAVWPVPHAQLGLAPYAFYVPKSGRPFDRAKATQALKDRVSSVELPKGFIEVKKIPRLANGKLQRTAMQELVERLIGELAAVDEDGTAG